MSKDDYPSFGMKHKRLPAFAWMALVLIFLLAGVVGHDPWRQDETYSFGIIYHYYTTHTWLLPVNAGTPFMEKPPLYYWTAVLFMRGFSGLLPLPDCARLTSAFYTLIACLAVWATSRVLFQGNLRRRELEWITTALFLGSLGLVRHSHDMFTDVALLAGASLSMLGMATIICRQKRWGRGGAILGLGVGIAFLSKGFLVPAILGISFVWLWAMLPALRTRRTFFALLLALLAASPFLFIWPWLLYQYSPALFTEWFWANNIGRFLGYTVDRLGAGNKPFYMVYSVLWFAFPAFPLAVMRIVGRRASWHMPQIILPLSVVVTGMLLLSISASARALYLLSLLPAVALLAAPALIAIPARVLARWNGAFRILASVCALAIVVMWICLLHPSGPQPFHFLYGESLRPGFMPQGVQWWAIGCALALGAIWFASLKLDVRSPGNTASIWLVGIALLWGLMNTLLLPWIDDTRSFKSVFDNLNAFVSAPAYKDKCIARYKLGESVAPMWEYFGEGRGMGPEEDFSGKSCPLLLLMTGKAMAPVSDPHWHKIWSGSRPLDSKDELQLFERNP